MKLKFTATIVCVLSLAGCATASKDVSTEYVSPLQYQGYDCDQIQAEAMRVSSRAARLGGRLDEAAKNDKAITGVGVVLFWPVLFALGGTKQQEAEYGRLKGEYDALQQEAIEKKCEFSAPSIEDLEAKQKAAKEANDAQKRGDEQKDGNTNNSPGNLMRQQ